MAVRLREMVRRRSWLGCCVFLLCLPELYRRSDSVETWSTSRTELLVERGDGGGLEVQAGDLGWRGGEQGRASRRRLPRAEGASRSRAPFVRNFGHGIVASSRVPDRDRVRHSRLQGGWGEEEEKRSGQIDAALDDIKKLARGDLASGEEGAWLPQGDLSGAVYSAVDRGLEENIAAPAGGGSRGGRGRGGLAPTLGGQIQQVSGVSSAASPSVLASLASYVGVAIHEQKELTQALKRRRRQNLPHHRPVHGSGGALQYGLSLTDEYDGLPQRRQRRFRKDDMPELECPGQEQGRHSDCTLGPGKEYNRMFYLDRRLSNARASQRDIRNEFSGVKKLTDEWRHLLVGGGGGSGEPGAFDSPYYFCYSNYQEDPEVISHNYLWLAPPRTPKGQGPPALYFAVWGGRRWRLLCEGCGARRVAQRGVLEKTIVFFLCFSQSAPCHRARLARIHSLAPVATSH